MVAYCTKDSEATFCEIVHLTYLFGIILSINIVAFEKDMNCKR
jgi:hypothetical protein